MQKYHPADRTAKPDAIVSVESRQVVVDSVEQEIPHGPINYLGKQHRKPQVLVNKRIETVVVGRGQYVRGVGDQIAAFVWLDDLDQPEAANDKE